MPFCVSSFAAPVKDKHYFLVFPLAWRELVAALAAGAVFIALVAGLRWLRRRWH